MPDDDLTQASSERHSPLDATSVVVVQPDPSPDAPLPSTIGRYRILRLLGEGGMGAVYEAEQDFPHRAVALKIIRVGYASGEMLRRFENETQALGRLQHPGIAQIYDAGTAETAFGKQPYIAMELVRGETLLAYCDEHKLNVRQRLQLMAKLCDAVQHAHQRGLIHRDLKPANILVNEDGEPKILDFGVARLTDSDAQATRQTDIGQIIGTLAYMSPEQVLGDPDDLDTRSDVYALGVILYELLAGKMPYSIGRLLSNVVQTIREVEPTALSAVDRIYRGDIETIVGKALEKDKTRRYASAAELGADIRRYLHDEPIMARPPSTSYQIKKFARRNKALVSGIAAVFVVLLLGVVASTWEAVQARRSEKKARQQTAIAQAVNDFLQSDLLGEASAYNQAKPDPNISVRTVLDRAAGNIHGKFAGQPEVEAAICQTIGNTYRDLGLYPQARQQLETALALSRNSLGAENPRTLAIMSDLAFVADRQGRYSEAEKLLVAALASDRRVLGSANNQTVQAMSRLGGVYRDEGKYKKAEPLLREAVETRRRTLGPDDLKTASAMVTLANTYSDEGKYAQAVQLTKQAVDIYRRTVGPENPRTLSAMDDLALLYRDESKYAEAERLDKETLEAERRVLGPEHPNTLGTMSNLALVYGDEGQYEKAEALNTRVLETDRRVLGPENPGTLSVMSNLAVVYREEGKLAQEEALNTQALDIQRRVLGPENPGTLGSMNNLASAFDDEGKYAKARAFYVQTEEIDRRLHGLENTLALIEIANIANDDLQLGHYTQAEAGETSALETMRRVLGPQQPYTLMVGHFLAAVESAEGKYAQAEVLYKETLDADRRVLGGENQETLALLSDMGAMYWHQGQYSHAEHDSVQALNGFRHSLGGQSAFTANAEAGLALVYISEKKFAQAEALAREALATDKKAEANNWQRYRTESLLGESLAGQKRYAEAVPLLRSGYAGMLARKDRIGAPDLYNLQLAQRWLAEAERSAGHG